MCTNLMDATAKLSAGLLKDFRYSMATFVDVLAMIRILHPCILNKVALPLRRRIISTYLGMEV